MLNNFYTEYITACCQISPGSDEEERVKKKYCTQGLLNNFHNEDNYTMLDADPFLGAQDCDLKTLETLKIEKDVRQNVYNVTYLWPHTEHSISVCLLVIKTEYGHKIDAVLTI